MRTDLMLFFLIPIFESESDDSVIDGLKTRRERDERERGVMRIDWLGLETLSMVLFPFHVDNVCFLPLPRPPEEPCQPDKSKPPNPNHHCRGMGRIPLRAGSLLCNLRR
ncbi:hypothetical protein F4861DRAFT_151857 [Xylaria intraflava]|nr:hypothetical protein F4861DRAFT_151857 [Xylaria intraflava]